MSERLAIALLLTGAVYGPEWAGLARKIVGFALLCATAVSFTFAAAARRSRAGVNFGTLALAVRVVALFLELFEDLTRTGVGLIVTGLLLVAVAYGWWTSREVLESLGYSGEEIAAMEEAGAVAGPVGGAQGSFMS